MSDLANLDFRHLWHPFTPAAIWEQETPLVIERGEGNYLYDSEGTPYFDGISSLWTNLHGHCEPRLNAAIHAQVDKVAHTTLLGMSSPPSIELAAALSKVAPGRLDRVFYSDSGSTAVEIALKQSFQYWKLSGRPEKQRIIHLENAYHGDTLGAVSVGGIDTFHAAFGPLLFQSQAVPAPHPYRSGLAPAALATHCLSVLSDLLHREADQTAAIIVEPLVQGAAGIHVHPPGYLCGVSELCQQHNVHLIVDEVATGFGRTGKMFACEHEGVEPDFLCLAKGITAGYLPLAATLSTEEIYRGFRGEEGSPATFFHGHTYTGNPVACAAALANLQIFREDAVIANLEPKVRAFEKQLGDLDSPFIGDVRSCGLMAGIELVADKKTHAPREPSRRTGAAVCRRARERNVLLRPLGDVLVLMPPLSSTTAELENLVAIAEWAIATELA